MKLKTKIIAFAATALIAVGGVIGGGFALNNASAEEWSASVSEWEWQETYAYASKFSVPAYELNVGDKTVDATSAVIYPDGTRTTNKEIVLNQSGIYTVVYYASEGGKEYSKKVNFTVEYKAYYVTTDSSSAEYGVYTGFGADTAEYAGYKHDGLLVSLANGDSLDFAHIVDVTKLDMTMPILEGFVTPEAFNAAEFELLTLRLTDVEDPSIYLDIDVNRWWYTSLGVGKATSFVATGAQNQDRVGYEQGKGLHVNNRVGTPISHTFEALNYINASGSVGAYWSGIATEISPSKYPFRLCYDYESNSVYANGNIVAVLDSPEYYTTLWEGFPSGKARISVFAESYLSSLANFCLTGVYGVEDLSQIGFAESEGPEITVNTEYETMPEAAIGRAYKVPTATARDTYSGVCEVNTQVWYNYASDSPVSITIKDGTFTPTKKGHYSIIYTAKDYFGNATQVEYSVHAGAEIAPLTITVPEEKETTATLGYSVAVLPPVVTGGSGNATYTTKVSGPDESYEITDSFIPDVQGTWTVTYTATDYIGNEAVASYEVQAEPGNKPVINTTLTLPKVYLNGVHYKLPVLYADDYQTGRKVSSPCDVKIEYNGNVEQKKAGDTFIPNVTANGEKIKITYYKGESVLEPVEVPVVIARNGNEVFVSNYIYGEGFDIVTTDENGGYLRGLQITAQGAGNNSWTFANPLVADIFTMKLSSLAGLTRYSALAITLTDSENSNQSATLTLKENGAKTTVSNGETSTDMMTSLNDTKIFTVSYSNGKFFFEKLGVKVEKYDNGEPFNGFSSNKAYVSVTMVDGKIGGAYILQEICGSTISYRNADYGDPVFSILGDYGGSYSINSSYTLSPAIAGDTFAPDTTLSVTVFDPDGNIITDKNGKRLEKVAADQTYDIRLSKYGQYLIQYIAEEVDWLGNSKEFANYVTVIEEVAPVITITSAYTETVKVGETIIFPTFTVTDNVSASTEIVVDKFVQNPTGRLVRIPGASNSVIATYEGTYRLSIMAKDAVGNVTTAYLFVEVTK